MDDLPNELLAAIFRCLPLKERVNLQKICKRWKRVIANIDETCISVTVGNVLFCSYKVVEKYKCNEVSHYCVNNHLFVNCIENACKAIRRFCDVKALTIATNHFEDLNPIIETISEHCSHLEHIEFKCNEGVLTEELMHLLTKIVDQKLKHFIVINQYRHFFNLAFGNTSIQSFLLKCPNLETFVLDQKTWVDVYGIKCISDKIKHLFLPWIPVNEEVFNLIPAQIVGVKSLEIGFVDETMFQRVCETCGDLSKFFVRQLSLESPSSLLLLTRLKGLQCLQLHFKDFKPNLDDILTEVCASCPLKSLLLYGVFITDKFVVNLCSLCPELEVIEFDFGKREITDTSIYALSLLKNIRCLSLPFINVSDEAVIFLISKSDNLTYLNLSGCRLSHLVFSTFSKKASQNQNKLFTLAIINPGLYETSDKPSNLIILNRDTVMSKK